MSESRVVRSLGVEAPGRMMIWDYEEGPPGDGLLRLDTLYTGFSAGTELTFVKATNPYLTARWEADYGVFIPGEPSAALPLGFLGYMESARVVESRSPAAAEGAVVGMAYGHKTGHTADPLQEHFAVLPDGLDPMLGIYVGQMGPICANGLLHAAHELVGPDVRTLGDGVRGRSMLVVGAGVVGLLTALFARWCGAAAVLVADPSPYRRGVAERLGFEAVAEDGAGVACKDRFHEGGRERGVDLVFQCRATSAALHEALRALKPQGTVIDLAFYQGGASDVRLGEEFHHNGLSIRCAQIGRVPRGTTAAWGRARLMSETVGLLQSAGPAIRAHVITDVVAFDDAPTFVAELVHRRRDFTQIVFAV